jgi:hypothetical protein
VFLNLVGPGRRHRCDGGNDGYLGGPAALPLLGPRSLLGSLPLMGSLSLLRPLSLLRSLTLSSGPLVTPLTPGVLPSGSLALPWWPLILLLRPGLLPLSYGILPLEVLDFLFFRALKLSFRTERLLGSRTLALGPLALGAPPTPPPSATRSSFTLRPALTLQLAFTLRLAVALRLAFALRPRFTL